MYSVVLMTALTAGVDVPNIGPKVYLGSGGCEGPCSGYDPALQGWPGYHLYPLGGYSNCWGGCSGFFPGVILPRDTTNPQTPKSLVPNPPDKPVLSTPAVSSAPFANERARLTIDVPADARLFLNDQPTQSTAAVRTFLTPPLAVGDTYYYVVRVEMQRDGRTVSESKRVLLHPGEQVYTRFSQPEVIVTAAQVP